MSEQKFNPCGLTFLSNRNPPGHGLSLGTFLCEESYFCPHCARIAELEAENERLRARIMRITHAQTAVRMARDGPSLDITLEKLRMLDAAIDAAREATDDE